MANAIQSFLADLTSRRRVIVIGGLAVIAHGRDRHTKDVDIWLEPGDDTIEWAAVLEDSVGNFPQASIHRIPRWQPVAGAEIVEAIDETGMVRVEGLGQPINVFRRPNELEIEAFEDIASRCKPNADGTLLIHPLDLIITKYFTGRSSDHEDIAFLESITRAEYLEKIPTASASEAEEMLARYSDWQVLRSALKNPAEEVRMIATEYLKEFAAAGDPFSLAILEDRPIS